MTDQFGRTITSVDNGDGTTTYSTPDGLSIIQSNSVSAAQIVATFSGMSPSIAALSPEKQIVLTRFNAAVEDYVGSYFDLKTQFRFLVLYQHATLNGLTNRAAYILPMFNWVTGIIAYSQTFITSVMTQTDPSVVAAMQWDFTQVSPQAPNVTLLGAIAIGN